MVARSTPAALARRADAAASSRACCASSFLTRASRSARSCSRAASSSSMAACCSRRPISLSSASARSRVDLLRQLLDLLLHGRDAVDGLLVRLVDGAEVAELGVGLAEVVEVEEHVEDAVAVALVHGGEPLAAQRLGGVELDPRALEVAARLLQADVEGVELGARDVVLLGEHLGAAVEALDLAPHAARLRLQVLDGAGRRLSRRGDERRDQQGERAGAAGARSPRAPPRAACPLPVAPRPSIVSGVYRNISPALYAAREGGPCRRTLQSAGRAYTICRPTSRGGAVR